MNLADFSTKNSLLVNLISLFIIIAGFKTMMDLKRDAFPPVDFGRVTITTAYPGASPEDVEKLVTIPIEKELKGISGIKEMTSSSEEGLSLIGILLDPKITYKDQVLKDIHEAVDRVRDLPEGVKEDPLVKEHRSKERPIIEISLSGDQPESVKRQFAEALEDRLTDIDGVASVRRFGWQSPEFWVEVIPEKLTEYHVAMEEIIEALRARNVTLPAGPLITAQVEYSVRVSGEFTHAQEIAEVVIRANDLGNWLKIKDVARVKETFEDETRIAKIKGQRAVAMVVVKTENGDIIRVADQVKKNIATFQKELPEGMAITLTNDFSFYVKRRLGVLKNNGIFGFVLVMSFLFLFLHPIPAIVTAMGIPIALFVTFMAMQALGISVNMISMMGLILVLGMLVDDGIIVTENAYRYLEAGLSPKEAAVKGTQEVIAPVTAMILTTCAAFAPLLLMEDILGKFLKELPVVVMIALVASLLEAFIILPSHICDFVNLRHNPHPRANPGYRKKPWMQKLLQVYTQTLHLALNHRKLVIFGLFLPLLGLAFFIWKAYMKTIPFTDEGIERFYIRAEAPKGTPLVQMNERIVPVENLIAQLPEDELDSYRTYLGSIESEQMIDSGAKRGSHLGQVTVYLTPYQTRKRTTRAIASLIEEKLPEIPGFERLSIFRPRPGPPVGRAVEISVKGEDFAVLREISQKYREALQQIPGVSGVETSLNFGKKQLKVIVDEEKARQFYLSLSSIAFSVRTALKGTVATTVKPVKAEEEIDVVVRFAEEERQNLQAFDKVLIPNQFGHLVPLTSVARVVEEEGFFVIPHLDGSRVIHIQADVDEDRITSLKVNERLKKEFQNFLKDYPGTYVAYGGEYESQLESQRNIRISFSFALGLIFIILAAMFKSLLQPLIVMLALPFGIMGVIFAFFLHGKPLSFFALMGVVGLTGVVVNDSIVLVDYINRLRSKGMDQWQSLIEAGQTRLRPVLMTSVTTIGGLISVAYGIGGGDPFLKPLALAMVWGLFFATALTLIIIPCIYALFDDLTQMVFNRSLVKVHSP